MKIIINGETVETNGAGGGVPVKPMTKAEYDALPEADKQSNVVYVITDDNEGGGGGDSCCGEIYSTEENRVGTWIDGKPLYRKVLAFDRSSIPVPLLTDVDALITSYGTAYSISGSSHPVPYVTQGGATAEPVFNNNSVSLSISGFTGYKFVISLEYTKTTDTAPTQEVTT